MFNFEKLGVWQKAVTYAGVIYQVTRTFPSDERFGLTSARPPADYAKFLGYAPGSLYEVVTAVHDRAK